MGGVHLGCVFVSHKGVSSGSNTVEATKLDKIKNFRIEVQFGLVAKRAVCTQMSPLRLARGHLEELARYLCFGSLTRFWQCRPVGRLTSDVQVHEASGQHVVLHYRLPSARTPVRPFRLPG